MATVVSIFFLIHKVTTDKKKNQRNTFQWERNERDKKPQENSDIRVKKKFFFVLEKVLLSGSLVRKIKVEIQDGVTQWLFRRENEMLNRKKALF